MTRPSRALAVLVALLATTACRNPCQQLCVRMADYAEECGYSVPEAEIDACVEAQADADDKKVCRQHGDAEEIRRQWDCEDLALYWGLDPA